jgi:hypothetical protein
MATKPVLMLPILALALLAGCSDAPPSGDLPAGTAALAVDGNVIATYTPASSGGNPLPAPLNCVQDNSPVPPPAGATPCVPAMSSFQVHFMALPQPDASGYHVYLTGAAARDLGALMANEANMWELTMNYTEDLSAGVTGVELRMGEVVLATASGAAGTNPFTVAEALTGVSATGSYKGKVLTVTVDGLPEGGVYNGRLYTMDEESGLLTPGDYFPVTPGQPVEYRAAVDIADHAEFHVHVGTSSVNLYKAVLPQ